MNREELIELKNKILGERKYVALSFDQYDTAYHVDIIGKPMTLNEIKSKVNTANVVKQCEDGIENTVKTLSENGEDIADLLIYLKYSILCEENFAKKLVSTVKGAYESINSATTFEEQRKIISNINEMLKKFINENFSGNFLTDYVAVNDKNVEMTGETVDEEDLSINYKNSKNDCRFKVSGFVNVNEVEPLLDNLGFELISGDIIIPEHILNIIIGKGYSEFNFKVDLTNQKSK